jgi:hypothetical protein
VSFALHGAGAPHLRAINKAATDDPFEKLATKAEREIARAIYQLLSGLPDTAWARELRKRIKAGDWQAVDEQLQKAPYSPEQYRELAQAVTTALQQGSGLALADLPPISPEVGTGVGVFLAPDIIPRPSIWANPAAVQFAQRYTYDLVRHLVDDPQTPTRQTLAVVISEGLQQGHNPRRVADAVDAVMGLTPYQARVVANFRSHLEAWGDKTGPDDWGLGKPPSRAPGGAQIAPVDERGRLTDDAKEYRLRDFRQDGFLIRALRAGEQQRAHRANKAQFMERELTAGLQRGLSPAEARRSAAAKFKKIDDKLGGAKVLSKEKIDQMEEAYARKWLKHRAVTIARTESIRALNAGRFLQWQAAAADGTVDGRLVFKRWLVSSGERTCPTCNGIARHYNKMNNGWGIQLEELFDPSVLSSYKPGRSAMEPVLYPILHPNCRCTILYREVTPFMIGLAA